MPEPTRTEEVVYVPGGLLIKLNREAIKTHRNRTLNEEFINRNVNYPVLMAFPHNDVEVRCGLVVNVKGEVAFIDIPFADYNGLPRMAVPAD